MKKFYKIKENIPNFNVHFENDKLIVNFQENISHLIKYNGLTFKENVINRLEILVTNEKFFKSDTKLANENCYIDIPTVCNLLLENKITSYTVIDALRDCLLVLSGMQAELVSHDNLADKDYIKKSGLILNYKEIPDFEIKLNFLRNDLKRKKYYQANYNIKDITNKENQNSDIYMYVIFREPVKIYTDFISGINFIISKFFGIHIKKEEIVNEFSIHSYNENFKKGLCIFKHQAIRDSFIDVYDVFDVLFVLLSCIYHNNKCQNVIPEKYEPYNNDFPIEL